MAVDWGLPTNESLYTDVLALLRERDEAIGKMSFTDDTNIPTGFIRLNSSSRTLERWDGEAWVRVSLTPAGAIVMTARSVADEGWLLCQGQAVSRTTYADLYAAIGTTYGAGNGSTTFNLPDLQQRLPLGKAASGTGSALGETGGAIDHTHTLPAHFHGKGTLNITSSGAHRHNTEVNADTITGTGTIIAADGGPLQPDVMATDGAHTHPNSAFSGSVGNTSGVNGDAQMTSGASNPPYIVVNFQIKT